MTAFRPIGHFDIEALAAQIAECPDLWDRNAERTQHPRSPHHGCHDIWLRYNDPVKLTADYQAWTQVHDSVWHPAYFALPALRGIVFDAMRRVEATRLGGCLITKIPPGGSVKPHADTSWHPRYYNTKVYIPLVAPAECVNHSAGESMVMGLGEGWIFDNTAEHSVVNHSPDRERITLILSMRTEQ